jgi:hypothetical protein
VIKEHTVLEVLPYDDPNMPVQVRYMPVGKIPLPETLLAEQKTAWDRIKDE